MTRPTNLSKTSHCAERQCSRNITDDQIEFACAYGSRLRIPGAVVFHVLRKDLPGWIDERQAAKLHGITLVVSPEGALMTTYRAPGAYRQLKKRGLCGLHRYN